MVIIENWYGGNTDATHDESMLINQIVFSDGITKTGSDLIFDSQNGDDRDDDYLGSDLGDIYNGHSGDDILNGRYGNDSIYGGIGEDKLYGDRGDDSLNGGADNDFLYGGDGNDNLVGGEGDDYLSGDQGDDILIAGSGNDELRDHKGSNIFYGGIGNDTISAGNLADEIYDEAGYTNVDAGGGDDLILVNQGKILARKGDDYVETGGLDDQIFGHEGNDVLYAMAGNDYLDGGADDDMLFGGQGNDRIYAGTGFDIVTGGKGEDLLYLALDTNTYHFSKGDGSDTIIFDTNFTDLNAINYIEFDSSILKEQVSLSRDDTNIYIHYSADPSHKVILKDWYVSTQVGRYTDLLSNRYIDGLIFSDGSEVNTGNIHSLANIATSESDILNGTSDSDFINGKQGDDVIYGESGDDILEGKSGHDRLVGGVGNDTLYGGTGRDSLYGGEGNDHLYGDIGSEYLAGGSGDDSYYFSRVSGGYDQILDVSGFDIINLTDITSDEVDIYRDSGGLVIHVVDVNQRIGVNFWYEGAVDADSESIEELHFSDGEIWDSKKLTQESFIGTMQADTIQGTSSAEMISGRDGDDVLYAGLGDDIVFGDQGNDFLYGHIGDDTLDGGVGDDWIEGGVGQDTYVFGRGYGRDVIVEDGDDIDVVQFNGSVSSGDVRVYRNRLSLFIEIKDSDDVIVLNNWFSEPSNRVELVQFQDGISWNEDALELYTTIPTEYDDYILGTHQQTEYKLLGGDDYFSFDHNNLVVDGGNGNDSVNTGNGNDILVGGFGNDSLTAGDGSDQLIGGDGRDTLRDGGVMI